MLIIIYAVIIKYNISCKSSGNDQKLTRSVQNFIGRAEINSNRSISFHLNHT